MLRQRRRRGVLRLVGVGGPLPPRVRQHPPGPGRRAGLVLRVLQPRAPAQLGRQDEPGQLREHRDPRPGSRIAKPSTIQGEPQGPAVAAAAQAVPLPLHPDLRVLDEPGRALVLRADHQEAATLGPPQRPSPGRRHPRLGRDLKRRPQTVHLAQERGRDPPATRRLLHRDQRKVTAST